MVKGILNTNPPSLSHFQALGAPQAGTSANTQQQQTASSRPDYSSQLQQLIDMGITDTNVAIQALQAAGGNVHLALDILYGGDM